MSRDVRAASCTQQAFDNIARDISALFNNSEFSDCEVVCSKKSFKCHKNILSCRSPVFEAMISSDAGMNSSEPLILVSDFDESVTEIVLGHIYGWKVDADNHAKECGAS